MLTRSTLASPPSNLSARRSGCYERSISGSHDKIHQLVRFGIQSVAAELRQSLRRSPARYQCRYSRVTPTNLQSLELRGVVIQALPELMALAFARGLPSDPASSLPISGLPHRPVVHHAFSKKFRHFAAVSKGKKLKEQKQKGQPHREDCTATTQRNPTESSR
jgi:hypothetical protein